MPQQEVFQEDFTAGEIDPRLKAREDFDRYFKAVEKAENWITQPTGGLTRSPGLEFIDDIEYDNKYWANNKEANFKLFPFDFGLDEKYLFVFTHDGNNAKIHIYLDDSLDDTLTGPWKPGEIKDLRFTQSLDTMIVFHEEHEPRRIFRSGGNFSIGTWNVTNIPQWDFDDGSSPAEKDEVQDIVFNGVSAGDQYDISLEGETTNSITYSSTDSENRQRIEKELRRLPITSENGIDVTKNASDDFRVTFSGDDGAFDWEKMNAVLFAGSGDISVSVVTEGESGDEDAWSATRGWPRSGTFYQQRLFIGGSKELPQTLWASKTGEFFNFDGSGNDADSAITGVTISSNQAELVQWMKAKTALFIGTDNAEYYIPQEPITPSSIAIKRSSEIGSQPGISPVDVEGTTLFIENEGETLREYVFSESEQNFQANNLSILASHLLNGVSSMARRRPLNAQDSNLIFLINEDGNMAVLSRLRFQQVQGFTKRTTIGDFWETGAVEFDTYFIVKRQIPKQSPTSDQWENRKDMPEKLHSAASAIENGKIHVIGGIDTDSSLIPQEYFRSHYVYDIDNNSWGTQSFLPKKRYRSAAVHFDEKIYFTGGFDVNDNKTDTVYVFDTNKNDWDEKENLPAKIANHGMAVANENIYLISKDKTYEYDISSDSWIKKTTMPNTIENFGITVSNDIIYTVGGEISGNATDIVQKYDPANDSWDDTLAKLPNKRLGVNTATVFEDTTPIIRTSGGRKLQINYKDNYEYDISADSWTTKTDMNEGATWAAAESYNDIFYVIGGFDTNGDNSQTTQVYGPWTPVFYLEKFNEDRFFDASDRIEPSSPTKSFTSFGHLSGQKVDVHVDGFYEGKKKIDENGDLTLDENVNDYIEVGYDLPTPTIRTLPVTFKVKRGSVAARKKRIFEIMLRLDNTKSLTVNGEVVPFRELNDSLLDQEIQSFSGDKYVHGNLGWSENPQVEIKQTSPQPATVLGILTRVSY